MEPEDFDRLVELGAADRWNFKNAGDLWHDSHPFDKAFPGNILKEPDDISSEDMEKIAKAISVSDPDSFSIIKGQPDTKIEEIILFRCTHVRGDGIKIGTYYSYRWRKHGNPSWVGGYYKTTYDGGSIGITESVYAPMDPDQFITSVFSHMKKEDSESECAE